jgi:hypothetical protein
MRKIGVNNIARNPMYQAVLIFSIAFFLAGLEKLTNVLGILDSEPNSPWIIMTSFILFFSIANSILSLRTPNLNKYWAISIVSYIALLAFSGLVATFLSGLSFDEAGSFRWLFMVLTLGYLVFLSVVRLIRRIVEYAIKQDDDLKTQ